MCCCSAVCPVLVALSTTRFPLFTPSQREVLAETEMMLPDTDKRLSAAIDALQDLVVSFFLPACCPLHSATAHPAPRPARHCNHLDDSQDAAEASDEDAGPKLEEAQAFLEALSGEGGAAGASAPAEDEEDI